MFQSNPAMLFKRNHSPARRSRRQWLNGSVQVSSGSNHFHALGINLSEGGMGFFAAANLRIGSQVAIEFLPPGADAPVQRSAKIRHRALYLYGVEFLAPKSQSGPQSQSSITDAESTAETSSSSATY